MYFEFQVGDIVVGNENASRYSLTTPGAVCEVTEISERTQLNSNSIYVVLKHDTNSFGEYGYWVDPECFDLVDSTDPNRIAEWEAFYAERAERAAAEEARRLEEARILREKMREAEARRLAELKRKKEERVETIRELISDSDRKYLLGNMMDLLDRFRYKYKTDALNKIIDEWAYNKADLIRHFRSHPNYLEGKFMIVFSKEFDREMDFDAGRLFYEWILSKGCQFADVSEYIARMVANPYTNEISALITLLCKNGQKTVTADNANRINGLFPDAHIHEGEKTTRAVGKLCRLFGIDKFAVSETNPVTGRILNRGYDYHFARYADAMSPLTIVRHTILSINPLDYLTMSFGNSWASCHTIDKNNMRDVRGEDYHGAYSSGVMSYMLDGTSFVMYTVDKSYTGDEFWNQPKITRQMFHFGEEKLIQGRLYPQSFDGLSDYYGQYRSVVHSVLSEVYDFPNRWVVSKESAKYATSYGTHYRDYEQYSGPTLSRIRGSENESDMEIGHDPICIWCGGEHSECECISCCNSYAGYVCEDCGCDIDEGDVIWIDRRPYCRDCVTYCECCDSPILNSDSLCVYHTNRDGHSYERYVCPDCFNGYYTYCDSCGEYHDTEHMIRTANGCDICEGCFENYYTTCEDCGEVYECADVEPCSDNTCRCTSCRADFEAAFENEMPARITV